MRRTLIAITALLCLAMAGSAYAVTAPPSATNNGFTAGFSVSGGNRKGVGVTVKQLLGTSTPAATGVPTNGSASTAYTRPYPLADIDATLSGIATPYVRHFPRCTVGEINAAGTARGWNRVCPKGSQVASGSVNSVLGDSNLADPAAIAPCHIGLHVYNAGPGKLAYFFTVASNACGSLTTGAAAAYPGTATVRGGVLYNNVPEVADISFEAGGLSGFWGSLLSETLTWNGSVKVKGKTYPYMVSTGCKAGGHAWKVTYTATNYTGVVAGPTDPPPAGSWLPAVTLKGRSRC